MSPSSARAPRSPASARQLTIGDLAQRTGVPVATLRTWESRYGAPVSTRLPSGHRRFTEADVELVLQVIRLRSTGLPLASATAQAANEVEAPENSLFRALARRHPGLRAHVLRKRTLLALTRAIEDECCARAERPLLFVGFQRERHYRQSQARWEELARTADAAFVFADFAHHSAVTERPVRLALPRPAQLRREWLVVCDDAHHPACVVGAELIGQHRRQDLDRKFEVLWSVDSTIVRDAARVCAGIAASLQPETASSLEGRLAGPTATASAELVQAHRLSERVIRYLDDPKSR